MYPLTYAFINSIDSSVSLEPRWWMRTLGKRMVLNLKLEVVPLLLLAQHQSIG